MSFHDDLVSVVIPVYNSEKFLSESIESVLNQTYKNLEIIAVDDGSTDSSPEILKKYSKKITVLTQPNHGLSSALNLGIKKMNGKWFKWFSPDDILQPNAIEILVQEATKLPENSIVYSNWELIDENGKKLRNFSETNHNDLEKFDFNIRLLDGQQINVNTTLIPTSLFKKGCTIREVKNPVAVDYDFFLRAGILFDSSFHLIQKSLLKYRINKNQLSHKGISKTLSYISDIRTEILSMLDESAKNQYLEALKKYNQKKSITKKTMEFGLKIANKTLPNLITDHLLVFYLNNIRRSR